MESWKDIPEYKGIYMVSNLGKIRSLTRSIHYSNGHSQTIKGRFIKRFHDKDGYEIVSLSRDGNKKTFKVHRLVAQSFLIKVEGKDCINHLDGNKKNNASTNLEWVTEKENMVHAAKYIGLNGPWKGKFGANNKSSKPVIVGDIRYAGIHDASRAIGVTATVICRAAKNKLKVNGMPVFYAMEEQP